MKSLSTSKEILVCVIPTLIISLIATTLMLINGNSFTKRYEKQYSLGEKYLAGMNNERAIVAFKKAIKIEPKSIQAYMGLSRAYREKSYSDDMNAERAYQRAYDILHSM